MVDGYIANTTVIYPFCFCVTCMAKHRDMYEKLAVYDDLISLFIKGLEEIVEREEMGEYENLLIAFESSLEEVNSDAIRYLNLFKSQLGKGVDLKFLVDLSKPWYISLKTTLYKLEESYIELYSFEEVSRMWDIFLYVDDIRKDIIKRFII